MNFNEFLVAPLTNRSVSYKMISSRIDVPNDSDKPIYFCFYEYFATDGARLALCMDPIGRSCFYSRSKIITGEQIKVRILSCFIKRPFQIFYCLLLFLLRYICNYKKHDSFSLYVRHPLLGSLHNLSVKINFARELFCGTSSF